MVLSPTPTLTPVEVPTPTLVPVPPTLTPTLAPVPPVEPPTPALTLPAVPEVPAETLPLVPPTFTPPPRLEPLPETPTATPPVALPAPIVAPLLLGVSVVPTEAVALLEPGRPTEAPAVPAVPPRTLLDACAALVRLRSRVTCISVWFSAAAWPRVAPTPVRAARLRPRERLALVTAALLVVSEDTDAEPLLTEALAFDMLEPVTERPPPVPT